MGASKSHNKPLVLYNTQKSTRWEPVGILSIALLSVSPKFTWTTITIQLPWQWLFVAKKSNSSEWLFWDAEWIFLKVGIKLTSGVKNPNRKELLVLQTGRGGLEFPFLLYPLHNFRNSLGGLSGTQGSIVLRREQQRPLSCAYGSWEPTHSCLPLNE